MGRRRYRNRMTATEPRENEIAFTFGEPEAVHNERILDYLGVFPEAGGEYYVPPLSLSGLALMNRANSHHGSCILMRRNAVANCYFGGPVSRAGFRAAATDFLNFGNCYFEVLRNKFGKPVRLAHIPALNMRVKPGGGFRMLRPMGQFIDFEPDEIIHAREYDPMQQIYGIPDWLGGLQSALLNQDATLFRRRYFVNGAHLGYILYTNDPKMSPAIREALKESFKAGKGVGNFKASYINIPGGGEKAIQIIPIGDIGQEDEFMNVKSVSAADVHVAHRVPAGLMGVIPQGVTNPGDPEKMERVYLRSEARALAENFIALNDALPGNMQFVFDYESAAATATKGETKNAQ